MAILAPRVHGGCTVRRSPLAEELERAADEGRADAAALASRRHAPVRATRLPEGGDELDVVPAIDGRAAAFTRAMNDLFTLTPGGLFEEP